MATNHDVVIPFVFDTLPIRGAVIQLRDAWHRMLRGHDYGRGVMEALGHSAAASALIAQSLKFDGSITLQISGEGPLAMLVMQCTSNLELRGMASAVHAADDLAFGDLVREARCAITVDAGAMERPYQGIWRLAIRSPAASRVTTPGPPRYRVTCSSSATATAAAVSCCSRCRRRPAR